LKFKKKKKLIFVGTWIPEIGATLISSRTILLEMHHGRASISNCINALETIEKNTTEKKKNRRLMTHCVSKHTPF